MTIFDHMLFLVVSLIVKYYSVIVTIEKSFKQPLPIFDKSSLFSMCIFLYTMYIKIISRWIRFNSNRNNETEVDIDRENIATTWQRFSFFFLIVGLWAFENCRTTYLTAQLQMMSYFTVTKNCFPSKLVFLLSNF